MSQCIIDILQDEEKKHGRKFNVKINNNRKTMLSVRWEPEQTKISLHKMFLNAPEDVTDALKKYITKKHSEVSQHIKKFINENISTIDYSHLVDPEKLIVEGDYFHLGEIYKKINRTYFKNKMKLFITWFGSQNQKMKSKFSLGLYHESLKLIKIHKLLDIEYVPQFVVEFVVFHEILHAVCPPSIDERGVHRIHTKEFKKMEKNFLNYDEAQEWLKNHQSKFFLFGEKNGWTQQMGKYKTSQKQGRCTKRKAFYPHI